MFGLKCFATRLVKVTRLFPLNVLAHSWNHALRQTRTWYFLNFHLMMFRTGNSERYHDKKHIQVAWYICFFWPLWRKVRNSDPGWCPYPPSADWVRPSRAALGVCGLTVCGRRVVFCICKGFVVWGLVCVWPLQFCFPNLGPVELVQLCHGVDRFWCWRGSQQFL